MKTLVLVEDEPTTLRFYGVGLKGLQDWRVLTAENGQKAVDLLRKESVDLLVTDLNMPIMDGYRLIAWSYERFPSMPIIVLTSMTELEPQAKAREAGALRVLSKPVRLSLLMEEVRLLGSRRAPGFVRGLALSSLLQLLNWEKRSCTMTVRSAGQVGYLYVKEGELIQAACGAEEGFPAAYEVLSWPRPEVEFVEACRVERVIDLPIAEILMNVAMFQDHKTNPGLGDTDPGQSSGPDPWTSF